MNEPLAELKHTLRERLTIVANEESRRDPEQHLERLKNVSLRLEAIEARLSPALDPQLRHYLQRRSYTKALEYLDASPTT